MADDQKQDSHIKSWKTRVPLRRFRWARVVLSGVFVGLAISSFIATRNSDFRKIRGAWLAEHPLAEQFRKHGARFNEIIWWYPENGESFFFSWAYKYYRQVQHIRFTKSDVSNVPFARFKEFEHLDSIDLSDTNIRADQLAEVCDRDWVEIDLCRTKLTREGLRSLVTTNRLQNLSLAGSSVTDDMLSTLAPLRIQVFSLADTQVGDSGMEAVAEMPRLHALSLARTRVGDKGLQSLSRKTFYDLNLSGTAITDAGLSHLNTGSLGLNLEINISNTRITDTGLTAFRRLRTVRRLNLANTQITDAGLEHLMEQTYLNWLCLGSTKVTSAGIDSLLKTRQARKDAWRAQGSRRIVEPPDLVIIMDPTHTNSPAAYPTPY